jgi:sigma-B regulation protein RsbU (phosphoserine phosphatase)
VDFYNHSLQLQAGQSLIFYTDGVTEACDCEQRQYGEERLIETLGQLSGHEAAALVSELCSSLGGFVAGAEPSDDITLLALQGYQNV